MPLNHTHDSGTPAIAICGVVTAEVQGITGIRRSREGIAGDHGQKGIRAATHMDIARMVHRLVARRHVRSDIVQLLRPFAAVLGVKRVFGESRGKLIATSSGSEAFFVERRVYFPSTFRTFAPGWLRCASTANEGKRHVEKKMGMFSGEIPR